MKHQQGKVGLGLVVTLCVLAGIVFGAFSFYGYVNSLRNESIAIETQLNAQYLSNQNYLSAYVSGFYEQLGVSNLKSDKLDAILTDAVKGRYGEKGFSANGAFFSAVREAYPDLTGLNVYDKVVEYIQAQRAGYRDIQDKLLDMLRNYDRWRSEGLVQSWVVSSIIGVPTERLEARIGTAVFHGRDARDRMWTIVTTSETKKAYETGNMEPLQVPSSSDRPGSFKK